jgi:transposase-like protein
MERRSGALSTQRQQYRAECKARVAREALKGLNTVNALASPYGVPPTSMAHGKHRLQKARPAIFSVRCAQRERDQAAGQAPVSQQSGQRKVEWDGLKKTRIAN